MKVQSTDCDATLLSTDFSSSSSSSSSSNEYSFLPLSSAHTCPGTRLICALHHRRCARCFIHTRPPSNASSRERLLGSLSGGGGRGRGTERGNGRTVGSVGKSPSCLVFFLKVQFWRLKPLKINS